MYILCTRFAGSQYERQALQASCTLLPERCCCRSKRRPQKCDAGRKADGWYGKPSQSCGLAILQWCWQIWHIKPWFYIVIIQYTNRCNMCCEIVVSCLSPPVRFCTSACEGGTQTIIWGLDGACLASCLAAFAVFELAERGLWCGGLALHYTSADVGLQGFRVAGSGYLCFGHGAIRSLYCYCGCWETSVAKVGNDCWLARFLTIFLCSRCGVLFVPPSERWASTGTRSTCQAIVWYRQLPSRRRLVAFLIQALHRNL